MLRNHTGRSRCSGQSEAMIETDDTVVPIDQSDINARALQKLDKPSRS